MPRDSTQTMFIFFVFYSDYSGYSYYSSLLFPFLHREAEAAQFLAERVVFAVAVGEGRGVVELELAGAFVDEALFGVDGHDVGHEHVVGAETAHLEHLAFNVQRA